MGTQKRQLKANSKHIKDLTVKARSFTARAQLLVCAIEAKGSSKTAKGDYCKYDDEEEFVVNTPGRTCCQQYEQKEQKQEAVAAAFADISKRRHCCSWQAASCCNTGIDSSITVCHI